MPLLVDVFGQYTIDEVIMAYKLAKAGKLSNHKSEQFVLYRELNFASASEVILAFEEYKKEHLGTFIQNQTLFKKEEPETLSENDARKALYEFFKESWVIASYGDIDRLRGVTVYDYLKDLGIISLSDEEKKEIQETAVEVFKNDKEREKAESSDMMKIRSINHLLKNVNPWDSEVISYSKRIALSYQIRNWILEGKVIDDFEKIILK